MSKSLKVHTGASDGYSPGTYWKAPKLAKVDINNDEDVANWCSVLGTSRKDFLKAVEDFGPIIRDIRRGLNQSHDEAA